MKLLMSSQTNMDQMEAHVSQETVKARIKHQEWMVTRPDAKLMDGDRLSIRKDIE
jgi:hypothetical protein